jgi:hypothetical protein
MSPVDGTGCLGFMRKASRDIGGYSEQHFSDFVKRNIAPRSVLFSRNARRFKRTDVDAWCAAGGPSQSEKKKRERHVR